MKNRVSVDANSFHKMEEPTLSGSQIYIAENIQQKRIP
jgi:hypothetical protein